jgi:hypothetical protein
MPWWAIVYLLVFAGLCAAAVWDDDRDGHSLPFLLCSVLAHSTIIYLFIAFWLPALAAPFGLVAVCLFVLAIAWHIFQMLHDIRGIRGDPDLSPTEQRIIPPIALTVVWLVDLPAFVVSGIAAYRAWAPMV